MKILGLFIISAFLLVSCVSSNFTLTGEPYEPLHDSAKVTVVLTGNYPSYDEIGVLQILMASNNLSKATENAKVKARQFGGDIVILSGTDNTKSYHTFYSARTKSNELSTSVKYEYLFIIGRILPDAEIREINAIPVPDAEIKK